MLSRNLEQSLHRALDLANQRDHEYATLEHLLMALTDDQDAVAVQRDPPSLKNASAFDIRAGIFAQFRRRIVRGWKSVFFPRRWAECGRSKEYLRP